jgi:hypothetical protein
VENTGAAVSSVVVALAVASKPTSEEQVRWPGVHGGGGGGCIRRDWFGASPIDGW